METTDTDTAPAPHTTPVMHSQPDFADKTDLLAALLAVVSETGEIPQTGRNDYHGYDYSTKDDILTAVRPTLARHKVLLLPSVVDREKTSYKLGKKTIILTRVTLACTWVHVPTGQSWTNYWDGEGMDDQDKGFPKAYTNALKRCIEKTFQLVTGEIEMDPEFTGDQSNKKHQSSGSKKRGGRKQQSSRKKSSQKKGGRKRRRGGRKKKSSGNQSSGQAGGDKQMAAIHALGPEVEIESHEELSYLASQWYGVDSMTEMSAEEKSDMIRKLQREDDVHEAWAMLEEGGF